MTTECSADLFGFAPVEGHEVVASFDGGAITSDAGALLLGAADDAVKLTERLQKQGLRFLMLNPRRVLSKAQILDRVWNYDFGGQAHVVELYISYLRKKIDAGRDPMIGTVRGVGYVLRPAAE